MNRTSFESVGVWLASTSLIMCGSKAASQQGNSMGRDTVVDNSLSLINFHYTTWLHTSGAWLAFILVMVAVLCGCYCCWTPRVRQYFGWGQHSTSYQPSQRYMAQQQAVYPVLPSTFPQSGTTQQNSGPPQSASLNMSQ